MQTKDIEKAVDSAFCNFTSFSQKFKILNRYCTPNGTDIYLTEFHPDGNYKTWQYK
jgi:hypothetical protein